MDSILKKSENIVFRKIGDESILVPIASSVADLNSIFNLNETGAFIWDKIDDTRTLGDIIEQMKTEYEANDSLVDDAVAFVSELLEAKLLQA